MIDKIIEYCAKNRFMVFVAVFLLMLGGIYAIKGSLWMLSPTSPMSR